MTNTSSVNKAKAKVQEQITKSEKNQRIAEFEQQEARRIQAQQIEEAKAKQQAEQKRKIKEFSNKIAATKHENLTEQMKVGLLYAQNESWHLTIQLSLVIMFIVYLFVFK